MMDSPLALSRLPVGSSASSRRGELISARAMAARCISPPESSCGRWSRRCDRPTLSSSSRPRALRLPPRKQRGQRDVFQHSQRGQQSEMLKHKAHGVAAQTRQGAVGKACHALPAQCQSCRTSARPCRPADAAEWSYPPRKARQWPRTPLPAPENSRRTAHERFPRHAGTACQAPVRLLRQARRLTRKMCQARRRVANIR